MTGSENLEGLIHHSDPVSYTHLDEIVNDAYPDLDLDVDPKLAWALRHPEVFPVDINKADYEMLLREMCIRDRAYPYPSLPKTR